MFVNFALQSIVLSEVYPTARDFVKSGYATSAAVSSAQWNPILRVSVRHVVRHTDGALGAGVQIRH